MAQRVDEGDLSPRMELGGRHDEVRVLAHSFDQMFERLEDAFARQSAFLADASHELRTPLTILRGQLEVLAMDEDPTVEEVRHVEGVARAEIDRMGRLVEDLMSLAHAEDPGFLRIEHIDLLEFLGAILEGLRPTADRRFELGSVPPIVLEADPDRLTQALRNLLRNAIVHTEAAGLVRLRAEDRGDRVRIVVDDDGPGVPPAIGSGSSTASRGSTPRAAATVAAPASDSRWSGRSRRLTRATSGPSDRPRAAPGSSSSSPGSAGPRRTRVLERTFVPVPSGDPRQERECQRHAGAEGPHHGHGPDHQPGTSRAAAVPQSGQSERSRRGR